MVFASKEALHIERSYMTCDVHNHPSNTLDCESTQMFSHLLAASKHCEIGGGGHAGQREGQNRGSVWAQGVGKSCASKAGRFTARRSQHCAAENTNHLPYITLPLTTHFIFCTNEFIIRRDLAFGCLSPEQRRSNDLDKSLSLSTSSPTPPAPPCLCSAHSSGATV